MTMDNWVTANLGKGIDYDGVYGVQCVDLIKHFIKNVLGVTPQSIGNAIEYYNKRKTSSYLTNNFTWIDNTASFVPAKGDIAVFTSNSGNGHVSVCTGEGTTSYFYSYDQNYPSGKHEPMTKIKHTYTSFLGVLRPKNQENIITEVTKVAASKNSICTVIVCNATMKSAQTVYVDNLKTTKAGSVSKGERVRALTNGATYSIIQYGTSAKCYKTGIVPTSSVIRD